MLFINIYKLLVQGDYDIGLGKYDDNNEQSILCFPLLFLPSLFCCSYHLDIRIDTAVSAILSIFSLVTKMIPKYKIYGGSLRENLALQNVQVNRVILFMII